MKAKRRSEVRCLGNRTRRPWLWHDSDDWRMTCGGRDAPEQRPRCGCVEEEKDQKKKKKKKREMEMQKKEDKEMEREREREKDPWFRWASPIGTI